MSYPDQKKVLPRLEKATTVYLDDLEKKRIDQLKILWESTKRSLRGKILEAYHAHYPNGTWQYGEPATLAALAIISHSIRYEMTWFMHHAQEVARSGLKQMRRNAALRQAWMIDQLTPPSRRAVISPGALHEAIKPYSEETLREWDARIGSWTGAYAAALQSNIEMGVLNASRPSDAADEVDATRIGTPQVDMGDALNRAYSTYSAAAIAAGFSDIAERNDDLIEQEIWQTRFDALVCEICEPNVGKTFEDSDDDIPAHPNCRCFWRVVPKSYADLLRSGDEKDQELAELMQARGLVPSYMIIRREDGEIAGRTVVDFSSWVKDTIPGMALTAQ